MNFKLLTLVSSDKCDEETSEILLNLPRWGTVRVVPAGLRSTLCADELALQAQPEAQQGVPMRMFSCCAQARLALFAEGEHVSLHLQY